MTGGGFNFIIKGQFLRCTVAQADIVPAFRKLGRTLVNSQPVWVCALSRALPEDSDEHHKGFATPLPFATVIFSS